MQSRPRVSLDEGRLEESPDANNSCVSAISMGTNTSFDRRIEPKRKNQLPGKLADQSLVAPVPVNGVLVMNLLTHMGCNPALASLP